MILPWNRREVYMGFDAGQLGRVREALHAAGIPYSYRAVSHAGFRGRAIAGNLGFHALYYVYVRREDYDRACCVLRRQ